MPLTPTNLYSTAKDFLREALARSTGFQALTGAADTAAARERIIIGEERTEPARPYVAIVDGDDGAFVYRPVAVDAFQASAELVLQMYGTVSEDQVDGRQSGLKADNEYGALIDALIGAHMTACDDSGTLINIRGVQRIQGPQFDSRSGGDDQSALFQNWMARCRVQLGNDG